MPGIITHNKVFKSTIKYFDKFKHKSYLLNSVKALFQTDEYKQAALFGCLGPNIFDYIPFKNKRSNYGHEISFALHNGGGADFLAKLTKTIFVYPDKNTNWAATQRAYLFGLISHFVTDAVFHPFVFYFSGFPDNFSKKEVNYYREQNLLFMYNIDQYILYHSEESEDFKFVIDEMMPVKKNNRFNPPIKKIILETLDQVYPEFYKKLTLKKGKEENQYIKDKSCLDVLPFLIKKTFKLQTSNNERLTNVFKKIKDNKWLFSDFFVKYPMNKRYNLDALNLHKSKWNFPAGKKGMNYDSIENLFVQCYERTIDLWQQIEVCMFEEPKGKIFKNLAINAYTDDMNAGYYKMKIKDPVRLYF